MQLYFAFVDASETTFDSVAHARDDLGGFSFALAQNEGEFATLTVEALNPHEGLLNPGRKQWGWFAIDYGSGITPKFFGRIDGAPEDFSGQTVSLVFTAKPLDFDAQKAALAETLKVAPFYDPIWLDAADRTNPDSVLEGYPGSWHIDPVTHVVTYSDAVTGEDGAIEVGMDEGLDGTLTMSRSGEALRSVTVEGTVGWTQQGSGEVDISNRLVAASQAAGTSRPFMISSYTGEGLLDDWPKPGANIGGGWTVGSISEAVRGDGKWDPSPETTQVVTQDGWQLVSANIDGTTTQIVPGYLAALVLPLDVPTFFTVYTMKPRMTVRYSAGRSRSETVKFTLAADVQQIMTDPGSEEVSDISLRSGDVGVRIGSGTSAETPLFFLGAASYFQTDRGKQSFEHLIARGAAALTKAARTVQIGFELPLTLALGKGMSLRKSLHLTHSDLPGGEATGKIVGYAFSGGNGDDHAQVTIGCCIGHGGAVTESAGTPTYVEEGYFDTGEVQFYSDKQVMPLANQITYEDFADQALDDDGVDFNRMTPGRIIQSCRFIDGEAIQKEVLSQFYTDIPNAIDALNSAYTQIELDMKPVEGGPFDTTFNVAVSELKLPKGIDLEAAAVTA